MDKKTRNGKEDGHNQKLGEKGEMAASRYLERNGYRIVERNFRCRAGEIDIVAVETRGGAGACGAWRADSGAELPSLAAEPFEETIVFVEVKTRMNLRYGIPALAVTHEKQRHLLKAAAFYRKRFGLEAISCRYDVIEILIQNGTPYLRHIKNAFS